MQLYPLHDPAAMEHPTYSGVGYRLAHGSVTGLHVVHPPVYLVKVIT